MLAYLKLSLLKYKMKVNIYLFNIWIRIYTHRANLQKFKFALLFFSHSIVSNSLWPHELQHTRLPCTSLSPKVCSNSYLTFKVQTTLYRRKTFPFFLSMLFGGSKNWTNIGSLTGEKQISFHTKGSPIKTMRQVTKASSFYIF